MNDYFIGLAVGLTVFFLLFVIVAAVIMCKYCSKIRKMPQSGHRESQIKEDYKETPQTDSRPNSVTITEESLEQNPIYENLPTCTTGFKMFEVNQCRSPSETEEDVYLHCDLTDDAIYSNDPAYYPAIYQGSQEDVYIVPDS